MLNFENQRHSAEENLKLTNIAKLLAVLAVPMLLEGCGVLAAPCRVTSAALKMVPVVGHVAALPTDACAAVIDP
jgi:hypothetical protein